MFKITGDQSISRVEQELEQVTVLSNVDLKLPIRPKGWWLGGEPGLVALTITWARLNEKRALVTYISDEDQAEAQLSTMSKRVFGFVALMMSADVMDATNSKSLRRSAHEQCRNQVELMYGPMRRLPFGKKVFLICVDHSTRWGIPSLYSPDLSVRESSAFATLAAEMVDKLTQGTSDDPIPEANVQSFGRILRELFRNTHEWARTDLVDRPWRRSVRGITCERHSWPVEELRRIAVGSPRLQDYFEAFVGEATEGRMRFFEFTVFDGGVGLARRWLGEPRANSMDLHEELAACLECLKKHRSTSRSAHRGLGLAEVMSTLSSLRGFIKIRTGRLAICRDFANAPLGDGDEAITLDDFPSVNGGPTGLAHVFGTHYQIIIPATNRA
jgi:hypothetical protein